ncbi:MAG: hypothetical protein ACKOXM_01915 [Agromyces sp.]
MLSRTAPAYIATETIPSGQPVRLSSLRIAEVNLGPAAQLYLAPGVDLSSLVTERPVHAGELIARSAVTSRRSSSMSTTVVTVVGALPEGVLPGALVAVWASPERTLHSDQQLEPEEVLSKVEVVRVIPAAGFAAADTESIEIRLNRADLARLLAAQSRGSTFTIVVLGSSS